MARVSGELASESQTRAPTDPYTSTVYPASWFAVMESSSLPKKRAVGIDVLNRNLVVYRGASGAVHAMDRFCPHMGTSLARGRVDGDRIVCAFHEWEFGGDGVCRRVPGLVGDGDRRIPANARIPTLPVIERLGWIWVFNGATPTFELPTVPEFDDDRYAVRTRTCHLALHPLMLLENSADAYHSHSIHRNPFKEFDVDIVREDEHLFELRLTWRGRLLGAERSLVYTLAYPGGASIFGTVEAAPFAPMRVIACPVPTGPRSLLLHFMVIAKRLRGPLAPLNAVYLQLLTRQLFRPVWEDSELLAGIDYSRPRALVRSDWPMQRFLRFYRHQLTEAEAPPFAEALAD